MKAVEITSNLTYQKINEIVEVKDLILNEIENNTEIRRPDTLVKFIFMQPLTRIKHFTENKIYAENTARSYMNILSEMGIVEKKIIQGNHYYLNLELYRILSY